MIPVSVIIPFFNAQKYLERCIRSVLSQTYPHFELILVNDCSTDYGSRICREYADTDGRVRIISLNQNKGVSNARNVGMEQALGKYIVFVDSDDWIEEHFLEVMLHKMQKTEADLVCCGHVNKMEQNEEAFYCISNSSNSGKKEKIITNREAIIGLFQNKYVQPVVWGKVFRKELIEENGLRFDEDISMSEDIKFVFEYLSFCKQCCLTRELLYWYVVDNPESAMNSGRQKAAFKEKWLTAWTSYQRMRQHVSSYFYLDKEIERVFLCSQTNAARMKLHLIMEYCSRNQAVYQELLDFIRKHVFLFIKYDYSSLSRKVMLGLCAASPKLEFTLWKHIRS